MKTYFFIFLCLVVCNTASSQSAHALLRSGDLKYDNEDYLIAEEEYRKSLEENNTLKGTYNLGNAIYQQKRFDEAIRHYSKAADLAKDNNVKARAFHNLGNALYAKQNFQESIDAYKNSLRADPQDLETKFNLSQAQKQLKIQQQQQQQQQDSDSNEGENEQEQQQEGDKEQQEQQQEQQPVGQEQDEQEQQPKPKNLSKEEAQQLLDIMDEEERKVQEKVKKAQAKPSKSSKDW